MGREGGETQNQAMDVVEEHFDAAPFAQFRQAFPNERIVDLLNDILREYALLYEENKQRRRRGTDAQWSRSSLR